MKKISTSLLSRFWRTAQPWLVPLALVVILRYTGALGAISNAAGAVLLKTGVLNASTNAPAVMRDFSYDFVLQDMKGNVIEVQQLRHKALFINIWATWCPPCRIEMPSIEELYNRTDTSRVAFLMISVDKGGQQEKVKEFIAEQGFTFPVYMPRGALPSLLQVPSIPTTLIVDRNGKVVMQESGLANYNTAKMRKLLKSL